MVVTPEEKASAGRVLIMPRGEWNVNVTYKMLDLVNHNGYAWLAKRTVVGIEPCDEYSSYWHNMLDINKIIENAIANTVADDVSAILKAEFTDMLSEARYVTDLKADFTEATFVMWDATTANTPYSAGLTPNNEGFALVYGSAAGNQTIVAWTIGAEETDCFVYSVNYGTPSEWRSYLSECLKTSGGTITGPLGLGNGTGEVSADSAATFLKAIKDSTNYRKLIIENPSSATLISEAAKIISVVNGSQTSYNLYGKHNLPYPAQIAHTSYKGTGTVGSSNPNKLPLNFAPKIVFVMPRTLGNTHYCGFLMDNGGVSFRTILGPTTNNSFEALSSSFNGNVVEWYFDDLPTSTSYTKQMNVSGEIYDVVAIG